MDGTELFKMFKLEDEIIDRVAALKDLRKTMYCPTEWGIGGDSTDDEVKIYITELKRRMKDVAKTIDKAAGELYHLYDEDKE